MFIHIYVLVNIRVMKPEALFKLIADQTRLRCLVLLSTHGELCVCEFVQALDLSQPKVSRHLATLRAAGFVEARRQGQWMFYRLSAALPDWANTIVAAASEGARTESPYTTDAKRFRRLAVPEVLVA